MHKLPKMSQGQGVVVFHLHTSLKNLLMQNKALYMVTTINCSIVDALCLSSLLFFKWVLEERDPSGRNRLLTCSPQIGFSFIKTDLVSP